MCFPPEASLARALDANTGCPPRKMPSTNEINAKNQLKKADGYMKPTLTRWKPDYEKAVELYESAARAYRASNAFEGAALAEEKCGEAYMITNDFWHAGKALERATEMLAKVKPVVGANVLAMAERASEAYAQANRSQVAAESFGRAARVVEDSDPSTSVALMNRCVELLSEEGKDVYATDYHRHLCSQLLRMENYQEASTACMKFAESCSRAGQSHSLAKAYLSAVIALLYDGDGVGAQSAFSDVHEVPGFENSDEHATAYKILNAYRDANGDSIKYTVESSSCVRFLDVPYAKLARKLPNPQHELGAMAARMGATVPGDDTEEDDDLT